MEKTKRSHSNRARRKRTFFIIITLLLLGGLLGYFLHVSKATTPVAGRPLGDIDVLASGWQYHPGVESRADGLHVTYLGSSIVQQDGAEGQDDPAFNSYGTYLHADGDFEITAAIRDIHGSASLRLYEALPIIQDEFRVEPKSIEMKIKNNKLIVSQWAGYVNQDLYSQTPTKSYEYDMTTKSENTLTVRRQGGQTILLLNGQYVADASKYVVAGSDLWFGLSTDSPGGSWTLARLSAKGLPGSDVRLVNTQRTAPVKKDAQGLQMLANRERSGFLIGAAMALSPLVNDPQYASAALGGNFGSMTTENALKWQFIHPQRDVYDFRDADAIVDVAKKNGLAVHGHTLVFGEANPTWVQDMPIATTSNKADIKQTMLDHIAKTVGHFKGRIASWDVVNEPFADMDGDLASDSFREHIWFRAMGKEYIQAALRAAHAADPGAKLYINDFGLEEDGERWSAMLALVTDLKSQGVPIDGVGFEAHVYETGDEIDPSVLRSHIKALAAIGLSSRISEMDVNSDNGTTAQAEQYADVFGVCLSEPTCVSWSTWGVTDRYDMSQSDTNRLQYGQDLLWDTSVSPTPALEHIKQVLLR